MEYQRSNLSYSKKIDFKPSNELKDRLHYTMTIRSEKSQERTEKEKFNTMVAVWSLALLTLIFAGLKIAQFIGENI